MSKKQDPGMHAVRRVRAVRETDSRIGLQQAVAERRAAGARVAALRRRLAEADDFAAGSTTGFLLGRSTLQALGSALREAQKSWETGGTVVESARAQWQTDYARLAAIDLLLARRAAFRRVEDARREARELDDLAAQRWLRALEDGDAE
jgi:flagellar FliJ protein